MFLASSACPSSASSYCFYSIGHPLPIRAELVEALR
ncbi:DUF1010 domain-containing protein [Acidovorax sp. JMULE5]